MRAPSPCHPPRDTHLVIMQSAVIMQSTVTAADTRLLDHRGLLQCRQVRAGWCVSRLVWVCLCVDRKMRRDLLVDRGSTKIFRVPEVPCVLSLPLRRSPVPSLWLVACSLPGIWG